MPDWLLGILIGVPGGGVLGYYLRAKVDEHFSTRAEGRQIRREDLKHLRDELIYFLGELRAHFTWLQSVPDARTAGGEPSPATKAQLIAEWAYKNTPRFPKDRRGPLYLITTVAYQLARGDRHFLDANPKGYEMLEEAWRDLETYAEDLTRRLHNLE